MKYNSKFKKYILHLCSACLVFLLCNCTEDETVINNYIKLSLDSYTFLASGSESLEIKVDANPEWEVELKGDWIQIIDKKSDLITVKAQSNLNAEARTASLVFSAADVEETVTLSQLATQNLCGYRAIDSEINGIVLSNSGKYIAGVQMFNESSFYYYAPVIIDTGTGRKTIAGPLQTRDLSIAGVTESGRIYYSQSDGTTGYFENQEKYTYEAPAGYNSPVITAVSGDDTVVAGYVQKDGRYGYYYPVKWINGTPQFLLVPERDILDEKENVLGAIPRGCSADGTIILGKLQDSNGTGIFWKGGQVDYISRTNAVRDSVQYSADTKIEVIESMVIHEVNDKNNVSPNGKYIAAEFVKVKEVNGVKRKILIPAFFNTETKETIFIENMPGGSEVNGAGLSVTDEGIAFFTTMSVSSGTVRQYITGYVYDITTGEIYTIKEYMDRKYSLAIGVNISSFVKRASTGGNVILGTDYEYHNNDYSIKHLFYPWYIVLPHEE